ncbi:MAG: hypothetical protein Q8S03_04030 [Brevundimonas sp.]|uniref:hypothetical protein n=1 Tax=Brevundimonas sp. TaxID=1871086 RepID=UPI00273377F9|nr:hypothetical protein [Brevundimonas sp.]MBX9615498.1 hypothetical protein [Caulobacteraceae bacterium]MDP3403836.1 hypothetical protein [Brevundimonas sp.]
MSEADTRPWFRSKDGLRWVPVTREGWAALVAVVGIEMLIVILAMQQVLAGRPVFMTAVVLTTPVTLAALFWLLSRKGKIVSDPS